MAFYQSIFLTLVLLVRITLGQIEKVHLQWAICDRDAATVLDKLGINEDNRKPYKANNITYFDTSPPVHTAQGVAFRTKIHKHEPISLIKVRFHKKDKRRKRVHPEADCVWDRYGDATYFTCGWSSPLENESEIWSEQQVAFAERYQPVQWEGLVAYGPFLNPKWKWHDFAGSGYKAVFDDVIAPIYSAGSLVQTLHLMEIEIAVEKSLSNEVHRNITKYLVEDCGVVICGPVQLPKTLRLFAALEDSSISHRVAADEQFAIEL